MIGDTCGDSVRHAAPASEKTFRVVTHACSAMRIVVVVEVVVVVVEVVVVTVLLRLSNQQARTLMHSITQPTASIERLLDDRREILLALRNCPLQAPLRYRWGSETFLKRFVWWGSETFLKDSCGGDEDAIAGCEGY